MKFGTCVGRMPGPGFRLPRIIQRGVDFGAPFGARPGDNRSAAVTRRVQVRPARRPRARGSRKLARALPNEPMAAKVANSGATHAAPPKFQKRIFTKTSARRAEMRFDECDSALSTHIGGAMPARPSAWHVSVVCDASLGNSVGARSIAGERRGP
jgi:hypothetical protein